MNNSCPVNGCIWTLETKLSNRIYFTYATDSEKCHISSKGYLLLRSLSVLTSEKLTTKQKKLSIAWFKECQFVTQGIGICILIVMFLLSHYLQLEDQSEKEISASSVTVRQWNEQCQWSELLFKAIFISEDVQMKHLSLH